MINETNPVAPYDALAVLDGRTPTIGDDGADKKSGAPLGDPQMPRLPRVHVGNAYRLLSDGQVRAVFLLEDRVQGARGEGPVGDSGL